MRNAVSLCLAALVCICAAVTSAAPADFARGRTLLVGDAPVQRVDLPQDVYEWVVRADLGDLRVFNGAGEEVPYALRRPRPGRASGEWIDVPLFTLPAADPSSAAAAVDIELGSDGTVVAVRGAATPGTTRSDYLLDLSQVQDGDLELALTWVPAAANVVAHVRIDGSDDLDVWHPVVASATLAALQTAGHEVVLNRVLLGSTGHDYLRLRQLDGAEPMVVSAARVRQQAAQTPWRQWKALAAEPVEGGYEFDAGGSFPVDRFAPALATPSYLLDCRVFSRARPTDRWLDLGNHVFYRAMVEGNAVSSDPAVAQRTGDRYWRVVPSDPAQPAPTLSVGWVPDELVFLKQGAAPFTLAYGQADIAGRQWPVEELAKRLDGSADLADLPQASLGAPQMLGGPERLNAAARAIDWRTLLLWGLLAAGVLLIGTLALRLARQSRG
ncbi:MAG: DUF3999 family protein [Pseudomonadales bacterium]